MPPQKSTVERGAISSARMRWQTMRWRSIISGAIYSWRCFRTWPDGTENVGDLASSNRTRTRLFLLPEFHWTPKAMRKLLQLSSTKLMQHNHLENGRTPTGHVASRKCLSLYSFMLFALLFPVQRGRWKLSYAEWRLLQTALLSCIR